MPKNSSAARREQARALAAARGITYTHALRLLGERRHHESALLHRALGGALSEAMVFGLGGGVGFMYFVFEYQGQVQPTMTVVAQAHPAPMIPLALDRASVPHEVRQTGSAKVAERNLREALASGRPAICRVGRFQLPWRPDLPFPDPVDVAVTGLDGETVSVDDDGPHELPLAEFMAAWSALRKDRHHLIEITGQPGGPPDVAGAIRGTAAKLTGPVLGNTFDVNFGLSGMRKLAAQLADTTGRQGWARRFPDREAVLTRLHDCLEVEYTAPGASRPLYADFLAETGHTEASAAYRAAGDRWSAVSTAARRFDPLERVAERVALAVQQEEEAVRALGQG
ncbi:BtrH N-terminal domain-containing protein [Nonomuraea sp. NPDC050556]|uniref:BtrH N-terminal domain-containing protein n=1 Tax=Nonomuraea sp. NPDC050556 TaxID=3364369 RepID=UPI00378985F4